MRHRPETFIVSRRERGRADHVGEPLAGARLSEVVESALRAASNARPPNEPLGTSDILLALVAHDVTGHWSHFLLDERRHADPTPRSDGTWQQVPLSAEAAAALVLSRRLSEAYGLDPMPAGALAVALAWNPLSGAARAFVGMTRDTLVKELQRELLGTELEGLERYEDPPDRGPDDAPVPTPEEAARELDPVLPLLPAWLARVLVVCAAVGLYVSVTTAPAWRFTAEDDLQPPLPRPALADLIPTTDELNTALDVDLVRTRDGLPGGRVFDSVLPFFRDIRHDVIDEAWAGHWLAADGKSEVVIEVVTTHTRYGEKDGAESSYVAECDPRQGEDTGTVVGSYGYELRNARVALYCSLTRAGQATILLKLRFFEGSAPGDLAGRAASLRTSIENQLPAAAETRDSVAATYSKRQIERSVLTLLVVVSLLWVFPTLLFDRATWQRLRWTLLLRRFNAVSFPGLDIDPVVRARLWSAALFTSLQALVIVWLLRLSWDWEPFVALIRWVAGRTGWIIAGALGLTIAVVGALVAGWLPRLIRRQPRGPAYVFSGSRRLLWIVGTVLAAAAILTAYVALELGAAASALGTGGGPDYAQQRVAALLRILALPLLLLALAPMTLMRRLAMRALRGKEANDERPPILLLRSFTDDHIKVRARSNQRRALIDRMSLRRWERFEEVLAAALSTRGPVLAVGQVGERLPPALGAVRRQFSEEEWEDRVGELMGEAQLICVTLGRTQSLAWEIDRIAQRGFLAKTVFVLPPTDRREHLERLAALGSILDLDWRALDPSPSGGWVLAVWVEKRGAHPLIIRARAQEDIGYDVALQMTRLSVLGWEWPVPQLDTADRAKPPNARIHPRGTAPLVKPIWRRPYVVVWSVNLLGLASLPFVFLAGEQSGTSATLDLGTQSAWDVSSDSATGAMYALIEGRGVFQVHAALDDSAVELSARLVAEVDVAERLLADGGWFYTWNPVIGTVQAVAPGERTPQWDVELTGARDLVAKGDYVYVAVPAKREVVALDRTTGEQVAQATVDGIPWSLAVSRADLDVGLADVGGVERFELKTLDKRGSYVPAAGATELMAVAGDLWAYSPERHQVKAISGPHAGRVILTRSQDPSFATNGSVLAIGGVEMISTLWPDGMLYRNRYYPRHPAAMAVSRSGDVLAATGHELVYIRSSLRGDDP